mgnify:CR=1 FL=1
MWGYTHPEFRQQTLFFKGFVNGRRIAILKGILEYPFTIAELVDRHQIPEPSLSRHMRALERRGVVYGVRKGDAVYWFVRDTEFVRYVLEHRLFP